MTRVILVFIYKILRTILQIFLTSYYLFHVSKKDFFAKESRL